MRQRKHAALTMKSHLYFAKAIRKYGWEKFVWEVIDIGTSNEDLIEKEKHWVRCFNPTH
ncbi:hypothetical protein LIT25_18625 [Bacillus sp. F19]|nr:hypothetical protein LIT25_18625 [Bacillus sp. F19]